MSPRRLLQSLSDEPLPNSVAPVAMLSEEEPHKNPFINFDCELPPLSLCIGLGRAAKPLVDAFRARTDIDSNQIELSCQDGTDPETIAAWSDAPPCRGDYIVLVIDACDPDALTRIPFWVIRLVDHSAAILAAIVIGDDTRNPGTPWRRDFTAHFDGVIDVCAQTGLLRMASVAILTELLLMLEASSVAYDARDVRDSLHSGSILRTAATVWSRPSKGERAVRALRDRLQPAHGGGVLAVLHVSPGATMDEIDWLGDQIRECLPDVAMAVVTLFLHDDWPQGRRVLGLTLADTGPIRLTPAPRA